MGQGSLSVKTRKAVVGKKWQLQLCPVVPVYAVVPGGLENAGGAPQLWLERATQYLG
jgi:hypothetical protein